MVEREGREAPCRTAEIPLGMPATDQDLDAARGAAGDGPARGLARAARASATGTRRATCSRSPPSARSSRAPIVAGQPDLLAEAAIAARLEQARSVADVLLRRTRLGMLAAPQLRDAEAVLPVAEAMGAELGWDAKRVRDEAEAWLDVARAEGIDPASAVG